MNQLSIAIPTFNRPEQLLDTLRQLLKQPRIGECDVIVIDNASDNAMSAMLEAEAPDILTKIRIYRNSSNVGLSGNILKSIETATNEWLWILADDDDLAEGAVDHLLQACATGQGLDFILFGQYEGHSGGIRASNIRDFVQGVDHWTRLGFLSAGLYRTTSFQAVLNVGVNYAYTLFPFVAMILHGVDDLGWTVALNSQVLVHPAHKADSTWALVVGINAYVTAELVADPVSAKRLRLLASRWCLGPVGLTYDFARRRSQKLPGLSRFSYEHKLFLISSVSFRQHLLASICRVLSYLPAQLVLRLIRFARSSVNKQSPSRHGDESVFGQI